MLVGVRRDKAMPGSPESNGEWRGPRDMAGGIRDWLMEKSRVPLEDLEMGMGQRGEMSRRSVCGGVLRGLVQEGIDSRMALGKTVEGLMRSGLNCHLGVVTDHS